MRVAFKRSIKRKKVPERDDLFYKFGYAIDAFRFLMGLKQQENQSIFRKTNRIDLWWKSKIVNKDLLLINPRLE
jgi:hypothetical protein